LLDLTGEDQINLISNGGFQGSFSDGDSSDETIKNALLRGPISSV
jgi:hypothetical protein